ncbi:MAG: hypothetical protein ACYC3P_07155 [Bellilinea sp.]
MIGLSGVRVIVVDDIEKQASPIIKAFSKAGIPVAFFDSQPESLPDQPLSGIRLAILDMDLMGTGDTEANKISTLTNYVAHILSQNNGPYAVLAWTYHVELVEQWGKYLFKIPDFPRPTTVAIFRKSDFIKDEKCDIAPLLASLQETLAGFSPLPVLQHWEGMSLEASVQVTNALAEIAIPAAEPPAPEAAEAPLQPGENNPEAWRTEWRSNLLGLMRTIAEAEAGKNLEQDSSLEFFYRSLIQLHTDRMESGAMTIDGSMDPFSMEIYTADGARCTNSARARINSMLHLAFDDNRGLEGCIYSINTSEEGKDESLRQFISEAARFKELIINGLTSYENKPEKRSELIENVSRSSLPIIIEINPSCDHAQKNIELPRFLAGILVDAETMKALRPPTFIFPFGPVYIERDALEGQFYLYFSARLLYSLSNDRIPDRVLMRLRNQVLTVVRNWYSSHASRPGYMWLPSVKQTQS